MARKRRGKKIENNEFSIPQLVLGSLIFNFKEFFNVSTLHGVRYILEKGRPIKEKVMWSCFCIVGFVSAIVIIISLWEKFQTNPTITGLDTDFHSQQLTFPTVMVCPEQAYDKDRVNQMSEQDLQAGDNNTVMITFLQNLAKLSFSNVQAFVESYQSVKNEYSFKNMELRKTLFSIAITCNQTFIECNYKDDDVECCDQFLPVYTEHGYCFIFNNKYMDLVEKESKVRVKRTLSETDKKWNLRVVTSLPIQVFLHSYYESPGWDFTPQVYWESGFAADLLISMQQTYTTEQARQLSVSQRKCIFEDERKMEYRRENYTFTGCMRECRIKRSLKLCGCTPPFYVSSMKSVKHCGVEQMECIAKYVKNITDVNKCLHCELGCYNTVFEIEKFTKTFHSELSAADYVNIEYLTWPIIRYKRDVLFGWVDLLVSFGGIAGLFLGFSLLSGVETIYYFTLRLGCMVYKNRAQLEESMRNKDKAEEPEIIKVAPKKILLGNYDDEDVPVVKIEDWTKWLQIRKGRVAPVEHRTWKIWTLPEEPPFGGYLP